MEFLYDPIATWKSGAELVNRLHAIWATTTQISQTPPVLSFSLSSSKSCPELGWTT